jgi:hypothetical protein
VRRWAAQQAVGGLEELLLVGGISYVLVYAGVHQVVRITAARLLAELAAILAIHGSGSRDFHFFPAHYFD